MRWLAIAAAATALGIGGEATAQVSSQNNPSGYANSGAFGRNSQPLSPYLNLLRGSNNAVNYYYGVRGGPSPFGFTGMFNQGNSGVRQTFFPIVDTLADLADDPNAARVVSPSGHPVGFYNTMGYFGAGQQQGGRGQQQSPFGRGKR